MSTELFDLLGRDDRRFSPFCWRAKYALARKGIEFTTIPVRFTDKDKLAFSGQDKVPVLRDGDTVVSDSWNIACHLEDTRAGAPTLFGGPGGRRLAQPVNHWFDSAGLRGVFPLLFPDIFDIVLPEDLDYFTRSRLERFGGKTRALFAAERSEQRLHAWRASLDPFRVMLEDAPFLCGDAAGYADYVVASVFLFGRQVSPWRLAEPGDVMYAYRERILDLHGGLGRAGPAFY